MKRLLFSIYLALVVSCMQAAVSLTAKAPSTVAVGEQFRLQYSVNSAEVSGRPQISSIPHFQIVYGPAVSTSQSIQIINGHTTQNATTSFTYTLIAEEEGTFTLPAVTLTIDGRHYKSNKLNITVVKGDKKSQTSSRQSQHNQAVPSGGQQSVSSGTHSVSPQDLYIEVTANKREVYEQEPLLLSYNVYTNLMLEQLAGKMPDLKGFVAKEIPLPREKHLYVTRHNGRTTQTTTWSQYVMFPQQSGKLSIPSIPFDGTLLFPNRNIDPVDAFFFGSNAVTRVNHTVKAPALDIIVKPLPAKPEGFTGAVGHDFSVSAKLTTKKPRENETLALQLKIHGVGNLDLITPPEVQFPVDFDTYDSKSNVKTELTPQGMKGDLIIDYLVIPNHKGKYTIPPIKFVYFNPNDGQYHTISTQESIVVNVAQGNPNSYAMRQRLKNDDISHIHLGDDYKSENFTFWASSYFWTLYVLLIVVFVVANKILTARTHGAIGDKRRTSKVDDKLKTAKEYLHNHKVVDYYTEVLKALQGFVATKTSTPVNDITADNAKSLFVTHGIDNQLIETYQELVKDCEYHIYAVSEASRDEMQNNYDTAIDLISRLNQQFKKKKK